MNKRHLAKFCLLIGDLLLLYGALFGTLFLRYGRDPQFFLWINIHLMPFSVAFLLWVILFGAFGLYDLRFMKNSKQFLYRLLRTMATNALLAIVLFYLVTSLEIEPRRNLFLVILFATFLIFLWRSVFNLLILKTRASRILFFGITKEMIELSGYLFKNPQLGQLPVGYISVNPVRSNGVNSESIPDIPPLIHFSSHQQLPHIIRDFAIDTIVVLREIKENKTFVNLLFQAIPRGVNVREFTSFYEALTGRIPLSLIGEIWFLENLVDLRKRTYEFFKRALDILIALALAIVALILFPFIATAITIDSEGLIFYRQKRVGKHGKEFLVIKYRSMIKDSDKMSGFKKGGDDPRHTRVGKFLRRSYLDELPQIINILKGEMSFVGPRPERPPYVAELTQKIPFYEMRLLVTPGITGWAQIHMEDDASVEDAPEKMQYDLYYVKHRSPVLDLLIIIRTVFTILQRKGR